MSRVISHIRMVSMLGLLAHPTSLVHGAGYSPLRQASWAATTGTHKIMAGAAAVAVVGLGGVCIWQQYKLQQMRRALQKHAEALSNQSKEYDSLKGTFESAVSHIILSLQAMRKQVAEGRHVELPLATVRAAERATTTRPLFDALDGLAKQYSAFVAGLTTICNHIKWNAQYIEHPVFRSQQSPRSQLASIAATIPFVEGACRDLIAIEGFIYSCFHGSYLMLLHKKSLKSGASLYEMIGMLTNALDVCRQELENVRESVQQRSVLVAQTTPIEEWYSLGLLHVFREAIRTLAQQMPNHHISQIINTNEVGMVIEPPRLRKKKRANKEPLIAGGRVGRRRTNKVISFSYHGPFFGNN